MLTLTSPIQIAVVLVCPGLEIRVSEISSSSPAKKKKRWNFICNARSIEILHLNNSTVVCHSSNNVLVTLDNTKTTMTGASSLELFSFTKRSCNIWIKHISYNCCEPHNCIKVEAQMPETDVLKVDKENKVSAWLHTTRSYWKNRFCRTNYLSQWIHIDPCRD